MAPHVNFKMPYTFSKWPKVSHIKIISVLMPVHVSKKKKNVWLIVWFHQGPMHVLALSKTFYLFIFFIVLTLQLCGHWTWTCLQTETHACSYFGPRAEEQTGICVLILLHLSQAEENDSNPHLLVKNIISKTYICSLVLPLCRIRQSSAVIPENQLFIDR